MRNLRLTEANVNVNTESGNFGLLAKTMTEGIVSNITLEGEIDISYTSSTGYDVGGLIGQISAGEINTVTSMVKITYTNSAASSMGGIVGHIAEPSEDANVNDKTVKLYYNSNYGPITGRQKARAVGGVVGSFASNRESKVTIDHCFNGSSVLVGYSGTNANDVEYHAGGILGFIEGENSYADIKNCYNAGIIKAGNKSHTDMAYAAGIVAHSKTSGVTDSNHKTGVYIGNCYNEGSIEALGKDPETAIQYATDSAGNDFVQVISNTPQNVSAYLIADNCVKNSYSIGIPETENGTISENYLKRNGSVGTGTIYTVGYKSNIANYDEIFNYQEFTGNYYYYYGQRRETSTKGIGIYESSGTIVGNPHVFKFEFRERMSEDQESGDLSFTPLENGTNNIPVVFAGYQPFYVTMNRMKYDAGNINLSGHPYQIAESMWSNFQVYDLFIYPNPTRSVWGQISTPTYEDEVLSYIYPSSKLLSTDYNKNTLAETLDKSDFVSTKSATPKNITINGATYTMLDGYNQKIFTANTYTKTFTVKLEGSGYDLDITNYRITSFGLSGGTGDQPEEVTYRIADVTSVEGGVEIAIQIYAKQSLGGWTASATIKYEKTTNISLNADSAFIYTDENSFAIDLTEEQSNNLSAYVEQGSTLSLTAEDVTDGLEKVVVLTDDQKSNYYFIYDQTSSQLIYYFNAYYIVNGEEAQLVNEQTTDSTPLSVVTNFPTEFTATRMVAQESESVTFGAEITSHEVSSTTSTVQNIGSRDSSDINVNLGRVEVGANNGDVRNLSLNGEVIGNITGADTATSFTLTLNKKVERFFAKGSLILNFSIYNTAENGYQHDNNTTYITSINSATSESSDTVAYTINLNSSNNYSKTLSTWLNRINLGGFYALTSDFGIKSKDAQTLTYTPTEDSSLYSKTESDTSSVSGVTIEKIYTAIASDIKLTTDASDNAMECDSRLFDGWSVSDDGSLVREYIQFNLNYTLSEVRITNNSAGAMAMDDNNKLVELEQGASQTITANGSAISFNLYQINEQSITLVEGDTITLRYGDNFNPNPDDENDANVSDYYELNLVFAGSDIDWDSSTLLYITADDIANDNDGTLVEEIPENIKNAIVTVSQGDLNYIFVKSDQFPNLTATITHKAESETLNLQVTKNIAEETYSDFTVSKGRDLSGISKAVYSIPKDGSLTISTPFQNAADSRSYFTDSNNVDPSIQFPSTENPTMNTIILTGDIFITDYINTPTIQGNGYVLMVAHNEELGTAMFTSYSNVSDAYVAGAANGASISAGAIDISTLNNNKFFGTVIKSGVESGDFLGFTKDSESIVNYMAIVNDGGNDFRGITLSGKQTLKGVIIAADAATNTEGGDINISGSTAQNVIVKAGDGANGRYSGYAYKYYEKENSRYVPFYREDGYNFDNRTNNTSEGTVSQANSGDQRTVIASTSGYTGGEVCLNDAEGSINPLSARWLNLNLSTYSSQVSGTYGSQTVDRVRITIRIPTGYTHVLVKVGSLTADTSDRWYNILGKYADDKTIGSSGDVNSRIWIGKKRGDIDAISNGNLWMLKHLFVTIAFKADNDSYETDNNTNAAVTAENAQLYPKPTAARKSTN